MTAMITPAVLSAAGCAPAVAAAWAPMLEAARGFGDLTTPVRAAQWLTQLLHESGRLRFVVEIWGPEQVPAQARYEGHKGLGNTRPGDGRRFRGRGPLQITGRANYARARDKMRAAGIACPDFEADPDALADPRWGALAAALWWRNNGANAWADRDDTRAVSGLVNRGDPRKPAMHLDRRIALREQLREALG